MPAVGRFAPSPSGEMHLGNLFCSLLAWLSAKSKGGRIVLRIEDLDENRCPRHFADQLETDLEWLGLHWDEGGRQGGPHGPYYQSQRSHIYEEAYTRIEAMGLLYPCFCSRAQLHGLSAPHREDGQVVYSGACRSLTPLEIGERMKSLGRNPAMRMKVPDREIALRDMHMGFYSEYLPQDCGDFVLRRGGGTYTYQLAVVVDDAAMGVTEVVRGADLLSSAPRQILLYQLLGLPVPRFAHLPLLLSPEGRRLSKRDGDVCLSQLKGRFKAQEVIGKLAFLAGLNPDASPRSPQSLIGDFSWKRVPLGDICIPPDLFA